MTTGWVTRKQSANPVPAEWYDEQAQSRCNAIAAPGSNTKAERGGRKTGDTDVGVFRPGNGRVLFTAEGWQAGRL